jgi:hypothetical protein
MGSVPVHRAAPAAAPPSLLEEIRAAVEDVVVGEFLRPSLASSAKTAALGVLHRRGVRGGQVHARLEGSAVALELALPAGPQRVQRVVLHVGGL